MTNYTGFSLSLLLLLLTCLRFAEGLLPGDTSTSKNGQTRRDLLVWPIGIGGAVVYGKMVSNAVQKISRGELVYPEAHEQRVSSTIASAMVNSIPSSSKMNRPLRVLEVGIGKECRVIRRKLYQRAYEDISAMGRVSELALVGVDITSPPQATLDACQDVLNKFDTKYRISTDFQFVQGSISNPLDFADGFFDCIVCTLTLCSVDDQVAAMTEIQRLLRPDGGCLGYTEHTAVLPNEPYRFLELQQQLLDPLQQAVAGNCHLHRYTDSTIAGVFGSDRSQTIKNERFLVEGMWPVSCESCGVIQRIQPSF
ncbi:type 11 methyltransferase [Nitzschia inconspicua]|uniref:Type 11 methyltransferase n=1 Tax=Nitzschia inconspicua TaxID=303405 RepID=A0A9K3KNE9_9STRA|nr:type 11 methyltransferase [Nitzschia inconspicua]